MFIRKIQMIDRKNVRKTLVVYSGRAVMDLTLGLANYPSKVIKWIVRTMYLIG